MMTKIFTRTFLVFIVVLALVCGGACYQTVSIVPFWQQDISMFKNYGHWGIDYFPILSPLMTVLWLVLLIAGFKIKLPNKVIFYSVHFFFLLIMVSTFAYFAPFLLTYMGRLQNNITDQQLAAMLDTWAKWDIVRQVTGLAVLASFIYLYGKVRLATVKS